MVKLNFIRNSEKLASLKLESMCSVCEVVVVVMGCVIRVVIRVVM